MPNVIDLVQGSPEWHSYRKNKLGASYAGIILGISPYMTPFQLWEQILGLSAQQEEHSGMIRGRELESMALAFLNVNTYGKYAPAVVESEEYPFICASLDGLTSDAKHACEIKCLNLNDHDNEYVLEHYKPQLQHQMYCCDLQEITYVGYHPNSQKPFYTINVKRDESFLANYIPRAIEFWKCIQEFRAPPLLDRDYRDFTQNSEYTALDAAYIELCEKLENLTNQKEEIREIMQRMSEGCNVKGLYTKMTHYTTQGRIDYKRAVTEHLPELNLEGYRGKPVTATRITKV